MALRAEIYDSEGRAASPAEADPSAGNGPDGIHERGEMMNPLKWPVWIRIAVVASIIWEGLVLFNYGRSLRYIWDRPDGYVPIFLFWSIAWIVQGIWKRHKQKKAIKEGRPE